MIGNTYNVQWGRQKQVDAAVVLGCGTEQQIRTMLTEHTPNRAQPSQEQTAPTTQKRKTSSDENKNRAKVLKIVPQTPAVQPTSPDQTSPTHNTTATVEVRTPQPIGALTPLMDIATPSLFRPARPSPTSLASVIDILKNVQRTCDNTFRAIVSTNAVLNEHGVRLGKIEATLETLKVKQPTITVLPQYSETTEVTFPDYLTEITVRRLQREASSAGHFGALLLPHLWPELFGVTQLRFGLNWNRTGGKNELNHKKKDVLRRYVNYYYPETRSQSVWNTVVLRINERLRRPVRKDKENRKPLATTSVQPDPSEMSVSWSDQRTYMDL